MEKLNFDNSFVNTSKPIISISSVIGYLCKPKDQEKMLENTYNKHYNNPESEYYHLSKEEIKEIWSNKGAVSMQYGSLLDDYIGIIYENDEISKEMYELENDVENDERLLGLINSFNHYKETLGSEWEFVDREKTVYLKVQLSEDPEDYFYVTGRFDALWKNNKLNKYFIKDWKSSKSIDKNNRYQKLLGPMKMFDDCNWVTYTIQTHFYKNALIEGNYFENPVTEEDINTLVVQLPGFVIENSGLDFGVYKEAFKYDKDLLHKIFVYAYKMRMLENKKNSK